MPVGRPHGTRLSPSRTPQGGCWSRKSLDPSFLKARSEPRPGDPRVDLLAGERPRRRRAHALAAQPRAEEQDQAFLLLLREGVSGLLDLGERAHASMVGGQSRRRKACERGVPAASDRQTHGGGFDSGARLSVPDLEGGRRDRPPALRLPHRGAARRRGHGRGVPRPAGAAGTPTGGEGGDGGGEALGSPPYVAPEQLLGSRSTRRGRPHVESVLGSTGCRGPAGALVPLPSAAAAVFAL